MRFWHLALLLAEGVISLTFTLVDREPQKMRGTVVGTTSDSVVVRDLYDRAARTDRVSPQAAITRDGKPAMLADLRPGDFVQIVIGSEQQAVVTSIEAKALQRMDNTSAARQIR